MIQLDLMMLYSTVTMETIFRVQSNGYLSFYWFSNLVTLRVHHEGYSRKISCPIKWISTSLLVFQYFLFKLDKDQDHDTVGSNDVVFHSHHGNNIVLSSGSCTAERVGSYNQGIIVTSYPLKRNKLFQVIYIIYLYVYLKKSLNHQNVLKYNSKVCK
jgi:hypothetical protein